MVEIRALREQISSDALPALPTASSPIASGSVGILMFASSGSVLASVLRRLSRASLNSQQRTLTPTPEGPPVQYRLHHRSICLNARNQSRLRSGAVISSKY